MGLSANEKHWGIGLSRDLLNKTFFLSYIYLAAERQEKV
jgi:hypothetical protein